MTILGWLHLEKRVTQLERELRQSKVESRQDRMAADQVTDLFEDVLFGESKVVTGSQAELDSLEHEDVTVEEREYFEEQKWLNQRKQKERMV